MHRMPNMHKIPIKAGFITASPKSSTAPVVRPIASTFRLFFGQIQTYNDKCRFFIGVKTSQIVQNNTPVIDVMNKLNECMKVTFISTFDFSTFYNKLPHNKLLMVLNSLIDICFDGGESK